MADVFDKVKRSEVMAAIRSKNTKPETKVRQALHRLGFRFRIHDRRLPGKPDIVLKKYKVAIQVRGCFWHSHSCSDGHLPKSNKKYWKPKLQGNVKRDRENDKQLAASGWRLLAVWECELTASQFDTTIKKAVQFIRGS